MSRRSLLEDSSGAVVVEWIIVTIPLLMFFLTTWQWLDYYSADLIVRRAASAAARAAAVVLPDDPKFYPGEPNAHAFIGQRKEDIHIAVAQILIASPHFSADFSVELKNEAGESLPTDEAPASAEGENSSSGPTAEKSKIITAIVTAEYDCFATMPGMKTVCELFPTTMSAKSTVAYQGASYIYGY